MQPALPTSTTGVAADTVKERCERNIYLLLVYNLVIPTLSHLTYWFRLPNEITEKLSELPIKDSSIKVQVTELKNSLDKLSRVETFTESHRVELVLKLNKLEVLTSKFDALLSEIEVYNASDLQNKLSERQGIEEGFVCSVVVAQNLLQTHAKAENRRDSCVSHDVTRCVSDHNSMGFKLPLIQITKFDGSYLKWMEFRDTFKSLIYENEHKLMRLVNFVTVSYLEGEIAQTIFNIAISSNSYQEDWD